jgi:cytochrome P450
MPYFIPKAVTKEGLNHLKQSNAKILRRIEKGDSARRDFCSYIFEKKDELKLTEWNLTGYAHVLIVAGSETSATVLTGLTYYLCRTPEVYQRLKDEVRGRFQTADQITSQGATLQYLNAVVHEALRIFPPVPVAVPRITPKGGAMVAGVFVPGGVCFFSASLHPWRH